MEIYGTLREIKQLVINALPLEEIYRAIEAGRDESTTFRQIVDLLRASQATLDIANANIGQAIMAFAAENFGAHRVERAILWPTGTQSVL